MFNLFKKESTGNKSNYPEVVEEIHNEFFTAGDKILDEAKAILDKAKETNVEKGKRLSSLGFGNVPEAVTAKKIESDASQATQLAELVQYYSEAYPFNKFITESQVKAICEKYGLVCGDVSMYKGFVPENKLKLIESFKVKAKDVPYLIAYDIKENELGSISIAECDQDIVHYLSLNPNNYIYITQENGLEMKYTIGTKVPAFERFAGIPFVKGRKPVNKGFKICAPLKDMEIPSNKVVDGYKIKNIPDPVVLQRVFGGYLIVAAWGDEASDEIVVNQINN